MNKVNELFYNCHKNIYFFITIKRRKKQLKKASERNYLSCFLYDTINKTRYCFQKSKINDYISGQNVD